MIGSLLYLTANKPDIQFSVCLCAHFQANIKESHLITVKKIFRYVELHSMSLTISPYLFWDNSKTFTKSILSLHVLAKKQSSKIAKC